MDAPRLDKISELEMTWDKGYGIMREVKKDETREEIVGEDKQIDGWMRILLRIHSHSGKAVLLSGAQLYQDKETDQNKTREALV